MGGPGSGRKPGSSNKKSSAATIQKSKYRRQPATVKTIMRGGTHKVTDKQMIKIRTRLKKIGLL